MLGSFEGKLGDECTNANRSAASAGLSLAFDNAGDLALSATNATEAYIDNLLKVETSLRELYRVGQWDAGLIVAAKVLQVDSFTMFLAENDDSKVEVTLSGALTPAVSEVGKLGVKISVNNSSGKVLTIGPVQGRYTASTRCSTGPNIS
jgi:hypothetical protein